MKYKYFPKITLASALFIASCAAWFSVFGISQLFIGASISTGLMALSLEIGKTVSVSFAYRYWNKLNKSLRRWYAISAIVLSIITSFGIYGYLMVAYTASTIPINDFQGKMSTIASQVQSNNERIDYNKNRISNLEKYRSQQENRLDTLIKLNKSVTQQQSVLKSNNTEILSLQDDIKKLSIKSDSLLLDKNKLTTTMSSSPKIGTYWAISQVIGIKLNTLVKWFILLIILVFDPLSIMLIVAYNYMVTHDDDNDESNPQPIDIPIIEEIPVLMPPVEETPAPASTVEETPAFTPVIEEEKNYPYYAAPDYDWEHDERWKSDPLAVQHYKLLQ